MSFSLKSERSLDRTSFAESKFRREDETFEKRIKASIEKMQGCRRTTQGALDRGSRGLMSRRTSETLEVNIAKHCELAQQMEQAFRDWTIHLAGEPSERHRKKFSHEKLQRAFDEECRAMSVVAKRVQDLLAAAAPGTPGAAVECQNPCDSESTGLLGFDDMSDALDESETEGDFIRSNEQSLGLQNSMVLERDEGIKRIQHQVKEVNQIFRDLGQMVDDQGHHLETIESAAEATSQHISTAVVEAKKMGERQQGKSSWLCCILMVLFLILAIVSGLILFSMYGFPSGGSTPEGAQRIETEVGDLGRWGFGEAPSPLHRVSDRRVSTSA
jgi:hypothetical protein